MPADSTTATSTEQMLDTQTLVTSTSSNTTVETADEGLAATNSTTTTTTLSPSVVTVAQIVREQNFSINEIPGQNDRIDENVEEIAEHSEDDVVVQVDTTLELVSTTASVSPELLLTEEGEEKEEQVFGAATKTTVHETVVGAASSNHEQQQKFRPRPEYRPSGVAETSSMNGQLYQDVAAKDQQEQTQVLKLRGV